MEAAGSIIASPLLLIAGLFKRGDSNLTPGNIYQALSPPGFYLGLLDPSTSAASIRVARLIEEDLLRPEDGLKQVKAFRTAFTQSFSMVGVAGAITAQIGITALSLPHLESTHWTVQACFTLALVSGCLCVYFACYVQGILRDLHSPEKLLQWLTRPVSNGDKSEAQTQAGSNTSRRASTQAAAILSVPTDMLTSSLGILVLGLGLYFILLYTKDVGPVQGKHAALATMVVYILGTALLFQTFWFPYYINKIAQTLERHENDRASTTGDVKPRTTSTPIQYASVIAALDEAVSTQEAHLHAQKALLEALNQVANLAGQSAEV